jgi:hypothetical protein
MGMNYKRGDGAGGLRHNATASLRTAAPTAATDQLRHNATASLRIAAATAATDQSRHNTTASLRIVIFESARLHGAPQLSYSFPTPTADGNHAFSMIVLALTLEICTDPNRRRKT